MDGDSINVTAMNIQLQPGQQIQAYLWQCGDEYCQCTEPRIQIMDAMPTLPPRQPYWTPRRDLWIGPFGSGIHDFPDEYAQTKAQTVAAVRAFQAAGFEVKLDTTIEWWLEESTDQE